MVLINEWLPNPTGSDSTGEWVEMWNNENSAVNISGWQLRAKSSSKTVLGGEIGGNGYAVFYRSKTKLVLKNSDEGLFLYDSSGKLVDQSSFVGTAQEGKSFSRTTRGNFVWSDPTPGAQNKISLDTSMVQNVYPSGVALNRPLGAQGVFTLAIGVGLAFAAIVIFLVKRDENLSKLFFGGN